ncbi:MAG TPA: FAD-dependent oxidoreductase [Accumulibacter sp.]|uniref:NAD(P)/FAD-dependent oxidoreductase n=2 Tax=Candidatus Accumulibacter TaxID=327159 RepID=A0A080MD22_9PROT|nr:MULTISPECIES: FAD-dependent oxidoreductase [Candidatus Accumulibacter]KFB75059.1 MAG: NADH-dependent phenylglyoxylate dehydrogenase subunit epsilon [Candidatus Accumulibacter cognatus]MBL8402589.1 NAD(P)/FAD-dependent oxidoreductase [Accumulibacter sp.]MBN8518522.1 NAD(P)/FAD-dependent oxidoreductase [Accumulibacter sp.]MBO3712628.1 NAD(P)/FAD-dependent oxidoreductase [Accumulibacter sp.]MCC2868150.1 FAD-dependent oxidoreductase [Candidatus Accumulibacter phosphatis]
MTRHVIIGNGPAGVVAAETLRRADAEAGITLIGDEAEPPYSRMAIPYLLMGKIDEAGTYLRKDAEHFERLRIRLLFGRVTAINSGARMLSLADGSVLPYDRLLIASGAQPVRPPVPGIDLPKVLSCWTLADARAIVAGIGRGMRVLQMGAGFIGCIIMESLAARGPQLTVVEMGDRMVPRMLDAVAGTMLRRWCEARGVRVLTGRRVVAIASVGEALLVRFDDGETLEVDALISATGVRPNIAFLDGSGVAVNAGVLVDTTLQTSVAGIYAAGDVAEAVEFGSGLRVVNAIQPDAVEQGRIAALNMAGQSAALPGTFVFNVLDTLGLISASFGQWQGVAGGETAQLLDETRFRYLRLAFGGDQLVGANCIGHTEHIGVLRGLIQGRVRLGEWKDRLLANPLQLSEAYIAKGLAIAH